VCFIHRPEYYKITEDTQGNSLVGIAEIIIAKHRNGATGDVQLRFKGQYAKFMNKDDEEQGQYQSLVSSINNEQKFNANTTTTTAVPHYPPPPQLSGSGSDMPF